MFFEIVLALLFQISVSLASIIPSSGVEGFPTWATVDQPLTLTWFRETSDRIATQVGVIRGVEEGQSITSFGEVNRAIISIGTRTRGVSTTPTSTGSRGLNLHATQLPATTPTEDIQLAPSETGVILPVIFVDSAPTMSEVPSTPPSNSLSSSSPETPTTSSPPTSITQSTTSSNTAHSKKSETKLIVMHVVGSIAALFLILLGGYLIARRIRTRKGQLESGQLTVTPFREPNHPSPGPSHPDLRTMTPTWKKSLAFGRVTRESPREEIRGSLPPRIEIEGIPSSHREEVETSEVLVRRERDGGRIHSLELVLPPLYDIRWCNT